MRIFLITIYALIISFSSLAQTKENWLVQKMKTADTVLLISHKATAGVMIEHKDGTTSSAPKLIIDNKLNDSIVIERKVLTGLEIQTLSRILIQPLQSKNIDMANCFIPHHAILIIKNGKISYMDICFQCKRFTESKDLENIGNFDAHKWSELKSFFLQQGFKYELGVSNDSLH